MINGLRFSGIPFKGSQQPVLNQPIDREHTVAILGSSKETPQNKDFIKMAYEIANELAQKGYNIVTGGGQGIMKAANSGANDADPSKSFAVEASCWVDEKPEKPIYNLLSTVASGAQRTDLFRDVAKYWIVFPGGLGTLEELSVGGESKYYNAKPNPDEIILMGKKFQMPLFRYFKNMNKLGVASNAEKTYKLADKKDEALDIILGQKLKAVA